MEQIPLPTTMVQVLGEEVTLAYISAALAVARRANARGIRYVTFAVPYADEALTVILYSVVPMSLS